MKITSLEYFSCINVMPHPYEFLMSPDGLEVKDLRQNDIFLRFMI
jgi:hypothetical protein